MMNDDIIKNEIKHGKFIAQKGEKIWNWSSPAGQIRWKRRCQFFVSFLGNSKKNVLEIGCGTGLFTSEIAKTNNRIWAIDISDDLIELAKRRISNHGVIFETANAEQTSFGNEFFDFVVGSSILHHLDLDAALKEIFRLLKPGGGFMFTEPNMMNPQIAMERNVPFIRKLANNSPDETAFFKWTIKRKFESFGFQKIDVKPFDFVHPLIPSFLLKTVVPILYFLERIPLLRELSGSLIITGEK